MLVDCTATATHAHMQSPHVVRTYCACLNSTVPLGNICPPWYKAAQACITRPARAGNEFCERLAFYGLSANLSIYLIEVMGLSVSDASVQVSLFTGTAYLTPLLGAWLADGYWGRFRTILVFSSIYAVVRCCRALALWRIAHEWPHAMLVIHAKACSRSHATARCCQSCQRRMAMPFTCRSCDHLCRSQHPGV